MIGMTEVVGYIITKPFKIAWWWYQRFQEALSWLVDAPKDFALPPYFDPKEYPPSEIVPRAEWGAREPTSDVDDLKLPASAVVFHHTSTISCYNKDDCCRMVRKIQDHDMDEYDMGDIGYNFLIGGDARVYEGRGWKKKGAHTETWNDTTLGVAAIGDFTEEPPSPEMLEEMERLIRTGLNANYIEDEYTVFGHNQMDLDRHYLCKCPGDAFYEEITNMPHWDTGPVAMELPTDSDDYNSADSLQYYYTDWDMSEDYPRGWDEKTFGPQDPYIDNTVKI